MKGQEVIGGNKDNIRHCAVIFPSGINDNEYYAVYKIVPLTPQGGGDSDLFLGEGEFNLAEEIKALREDWQTMTSQAEFDQAVYYALRAHGDIQVFSRSAGGRVLTGSICNLTCIKSCTGIFAVAVSRESTDIYYQDRELSRHNSVCAVL
jgi:hypothetical protein